MARKNRNPNNWFDTCDRDGNSLVKELRRETDRRGIPMSERQGGGSHRIAKFSETDTTRPGIVPIPMHEIPKGTWGSIARSLKMIGILLVLALIFMVVML